MRIQSSARIDPSCQRSGRRSRRARIRSDSSRLPPPTPTPRPTRRRMRRRLRRFLTQLAKGGGVGGVGGGEGGEGRFAPKTPAMTPTPPAWATLGMGAACLAKLEGVGWVRATVVGVTHMGYPNARFRVKCEQGRVEGGGEGRSGRWMPVRSNRRLRRKSTMRVPRVDTFGVRAGASVARAVHSAMVD